MPDFHIQIYFQTPTLDYRVLFFRLCFHHPPVAAARRIDRGSLCLADYATCRQPWRKAPESFEQNCTANDQAVYFD